MKEIELIKNLEKISYRFPDRLLKLEGYIIKEHSREFLEIIIYKGFSSSTTHQIESDANKEVIALDHFLTNFKLFKAPLTKGSEVIIRENTNTLFFLNQKNWT